MTDTWPPPPTIRVRPDAIERLKRQRQAAPEPKCGYGRRRAAAARAAVPAGFVDVPVMVGTAAQVATLRLPSTSTMDPETVAFLRFKMLAAYDAYYRPEQDAATPSTTTTETP